MRVVYIINIRGYSTEEINQVLKKLLTSFKNILNYQVINKLINKSNLSVLRAPQVYKKSQEQFKVTIEKKKIIFEFSKFNLENSANLFEKVLKKVKLHSIYSNTDILIKKKIYFYDVLKPFSLFR
jgi:ribosomal protein S10